MTDIMQVSTTTDSREAAHAIATAAIKTHLAACAQVSGPIESTYWWDGQVEAAEEWVCTLKTRRDLFADLAEAIREVHPYQTPEILGVHIDEANEAYETWVKDSVRPQQE